MDTKEEKRTSKVLISILIVLLLLFILVLSVFYIKSITTVFPKASSFNSASLFSFSNSYIFAAPVRAKANGDFIRVTIFVLDDEGRGLFDKEVILGNNNSIQVNNLQSLTDDTGKALFDISSNSTGVFYVEALVDGVLLPQTVKVTFD